MFKTMKNISLLCLMTAAAISGMEKEQKTPEWWTNWFIVEPKLTPKDDVDATFLNDKFNQGIQDLLSQKRKGKNIVIGPVTNNLVMFLRSVRLDENRVREEFTNQCGYPAPTEEDVKRYEEQYSERQEKMKSIVQELMQKEEFKGLECLKGCKKFLETREDKLLNLQEHLKPFLSPSTLRRKYLKTYVREHLQQVDGEDVDRDEKVDDLPKGKVYRLKAPTEGALKQLKYFQSVMQEGLNKALISNQPIDFQRFKLALGQLSTAEEEFLTEDLYLWATSLVYNIFFAKEARDYFPSAPSQESPQKIEYRKLKEYAQSLDFLHQFTKQLTTWENENNKVNPLSSLFLGTFLPQLPGIQAELLCAEELKGFLPPKIQDTLWSHLDTANPEKTAKEINNRAGMDILDPADVNNCTEITWAADKQRGEWVSGIEGSEITLSPYQWLDQVYKISFVALTIEKKPNLFLKSFKNGYHFFTVMAQSEFYITFKISNSNLDYSRNQFNSKSSKNLTFNTTLAIPLTLSDLYDHGEMIKEYSPHKPMFKNDNGKEGIAQLIFPKINLKETNPELLEVIKELFPTQAEGYSAKGNDQKEYIKFFKNHTHLVLDKNGFSFESVTAAGSVARGTGEETNVENPRFYPMGAPFSLAIWSLEPGKLECEGKRTIGVEFLPLLHSSAQINCPPFN